MLRTLATFMLLMLAVNAHAAMYKWVDEQGVTHFSERPPAGQQAQKLRPPPPPPVPPEEAQQQLQKKLDAFNERDAARKTAATEAEQQATEQAQRKQRCAEARNNLQAIENAGGRRMMGPDGAIIAPTDAQREAAKQQVRDVIEESCD